MTYSFAPIIMCGGSGTRLWPASRKSLPKQFLNLTGGEYSLFQNTVLRLKGLANAAPPIIICSNDHRFLVAEQLRQIDADSSVILLEPVARNTAAAIIAAASWANNQTALNQAQLLVFPADHYIVDHDSLIRACQQSASSGTAGYISVFGIQPQHPETGYGYIEQGPLDDCTNNFTVSSFKEKPDLETAKHYCDSGRFFWNGGIFGFSAKTILAAAEKHAPAVKQHAQLAVAKAQEDLDFLRLDEDHFSQCPDISIDYAILEQADNIQMTTLSARWSDLGAWRSVAALSDADNNNNRLIGDITTVDSQGCYVNAQQRHVSLLGVNDLVVIEREDAVLVTTIDESQNVGSLVKVLRQQGQGCADNHAETHRPWGSYRSIDSGEGFQVKRITVLPGRKLSLQKHFKRAEHWVVVSGTAQITRNQETMTLNANQSTYIPLGAIHRLENIGDGVLELIEVQSGDYLGEDDIVRLEDLYGRSGH